MEGSTTLGWIGLGSATLAAASLIRSRVKPTDADPRTHAFTEALTAIWLSLSLTPVEKAFTVEGDPISWILIALRLALVVFMFSQLRRAWRVQTSDSKTEV
jgi:hypothetical protein